MTVTHAPVQKGRWWSCTCGFRKTRPYTKQAVMTHIGQQRRLEALKGRAQRD